MFDRILIPLDGSELAEEAIREVLAFFRGEEVEYLLLVVTDPDPTREAGNAPTGGADVARDYLEGVAGRLRREGLRTTVHVRGGPPSETILTFSQEREIELIAMSTHGRSGIDRLVRGSVAESVLRSARVPLLLVRKTDTLEPAPGSRGGRPYRILVPLDGTPEAESVLPYLPHLAARTRGMVEILHVEQDSNEDPAPAPGPARPEAAKPIPYSSSVCRRLWREGITAEERVLRGSPATQILERVGWGDVDLVAMSTHGHSGATRMVLGSVTETVLRSLRIPLFATRIWKSTPQSPGSNLPE